MADQNNTFMFVIVQKSKIKIKNSSFKYIQQKIDLTAQPQETIYTLSN